MSRGASKSDRASGSGSPLWSTRPTGQGVDQGRVRRGPGAFVGFGELGVKQLTLHAQLGPALVGTASATAARRAAPRGARVRHGQEDHRKRHLVVDTLGLMLIVMVTSATVQDRAGGRAILERLAARFPTVALVWADGGYANKIDFSILAWAKEKLGLLVEIVKRSDDVKGFQVLPRRWVVERTFGWLVRNRRLARDYERLTATSEAMIKVAMIRLMARRIAGQSVTWSNATEREALRRFKIESLLAA